MNRFEITKNNDYVGMVMPTVSVTFWLFSEDVHYIASELYVYFSELLHVT
ncbi:MAG: hypothetical protein QN229_02970 [Desulfurococcaceae archaeon TW002]